MPTLQLAFQINLGTVEALVRLRAFTSIYLSPLLLTSGEYNRFGGGPSHVCFNRMGKIVLALNIQLRFLVKWLLLTPFCFWLLMTSSCFVAVFTSSAVTEKLVQHTFYFVIGILQESFCKNAPLFTAYLESEIYICLFTLMPGRELHKGCECFTCFWVYFRVVFPILPSIEAGWGELFFT